MKNILAILLLIITFDAFAQKQLIGIEGGFSRTNIDAKNTRGKSYDRNGYSFGLNYEYLLKHPFTIEVGLGYSQKGFKDKVTIVDINQNYIDKVYFRHNFDYISIPIKTGIIFGNKVFGFAKIGIVPSILINANLIAPDFDNNGKRMTDRSVDLSDNISKFDFAGLGQIGSGFKLKNNYRLFASLSYQKSFTSISTSQDYLGSGVMHRGLNFSVGISSIIGKN